MRKVNRRRFLKQSGVATVGMAALAGCTGDDGNGDDAGAGGNGNGNGADDGNGDAGVDYPTQSITMTIPFGEGGGTDTFARTVGRAAADFLDEPIEMQNESGAGGLIGTQQVFRQEPDGYNMVAFNPPSTPMSWFIQQPDFEIGDLEAVCTIGRFPYIITANSDYEVEGFGDLVDRFEDGEFSQIAGQGSGTLVDVVARVLRDEVGLAWDDYIAYEGGGEVTQAIMGDEVSVGIGTDSGALSGVEEERMDPIAIIPSGGSAVFPDTETIAEQGFADEGDNIDLLAMLQPSWYMPPGTPMEVREIVSEAAREGIDTDEVQQFGEDSGNVVEHSGPEEAQEILDEVLETIPEVVDIDELREDA